jgi:hypothetical protein
MGEPCGGSRDRREVGAIGVHPPNIRGEVVVRGVRPIVAARGLENDRVSRRSSAAIRAGIWTCATSGTGAAASASVFAAASSTATSNREHENKRLRQRANNAFQIVHRPPRTFHQLNFPGVASRSRTYGHL